MSRECLSVGGFDLIFDLPEGISLSGSNYGSFLRAESEANEKIFIRVLKEEIPSIYLSNWKSSSLLLDSNSTWAMNRSEDSNWAFHLGPSPTQTSDPPVFHLLANQDFTRSQLYLGKEFSNPLIQSGDFYPLDEVYVRHLLAGRGGFHLHAAGVEIGGKGYLFLGDSGAGKSTIASYFLEALGGARVYSDDRIIVRNVDGVWKMFGSPWHGTLAQILPESLELGGLCFIEKSHEHRMKLLSPSEAMAKTAQTYLGVWWVPELRLAQLAALEKLITDDSVLFCSLGFSLDSNIVKFFSNEINSL